MTCSSVVVPMMLYVLTAGLAVAVRASEKNAGDERERGWEQTWDRGDVDATIRRGAKHESRGPGLLRAAA